MEQGIRGVGVSSCVQDEVLTYPLGTSQWDEDHSCYCPHAMTERGYSAHLPRQHCPIMMKSVSTNP